MIDSLYGQDDDTRHRMIDAVTGDDKNDKNDDAED